MKSRDIQPVPIPDNKGVHIRTAGAKGEKYVYKYVKYFRNSEEFLGHKHENMTRRYIDCIQRHVVQSSEQYYKE